MSTGQRFLKGLALGLAVIVIVIMFSVAMLFLTVFTDITFENNKHNKNGKCRLDFFFTIATNINFSWF